MRALVVLAVVAVGVVGAVIGAGCGVAVDGDFDGVPFAPNNALLAVADRQDLLLRGGAVVPVRRDDNAMTLDVLLTAARIDVTNDWRRLPAEDILEIKRDLATSDGLLLKDVPLPAFSDKKTLVAVLDAGQVTGDFDMAIGAGPPPADTIKEQGLGSKVRVTITPQSVDARPRGGNISAKVEVQREREAGQDGEVAVGTVNLSFSTGFLDERLGESNLTVAIPVLECMQELGPARAAQCKNVDELPYVDETGLVDP